jgi:hypothetical protein
MSSCSLGDIELVEGIACGSERLGLGLWALRGRGNDIARLIVIKIIRIVNELRWSVVPEA